MRNNYVVERVTLIFANKLPGLSLKPAQLFVYSGQLSEPAVVVSGDNYLNPAYPIIPGWIGLPGRLA